MNYPVLPPTGGSSRQVAQAVNYLLTNQTAASVPNVIANPLDFGAKADGTDDAAAFKAALESGEIIDGLGLTYAFSDEVKPTAISRIQNANLKWISTSAMTAQNKALLHIDGLSNFTVDNVSFDMGTVENTGSENDSGRRGIRIENTSGGRCNRVQVTRCDGFGKGNGTVIDVRDTRGAFVAFNRVHDRRMIMGDSGTADNDAMDGFNIQNGDDMMFVGNRVYDQTTSADGGTTYTNDLNRGVAIVGMQNSIIADNHVRLVGQGYDFSGNLSINGGNRGLTIVGNTGAYCFSWAFKFVHGIKDCAIDACIARFTGRCGFVFNTDDYAAATDHTQRLYLSNCHAIHGWAPPYSAVDYPTAPSGAWTNQWRGFRIMDNNPANGVRNLRFDLCSAFDDQGFMDYGWHSENTSDTTSNIMRNCEVTGASVNQYNLAGTSGFASSAWRTL